MQNLSDRAQNVLVTAVVDGYKEYPLRWREHTLGPGWVLKCLSGDYALLNVPGEHQIVWKINGVTAEVFTFTVTGPESAAPGGPEELLHQTEQPADLTEAQEEDGE